MNEPTFFKLSLSFDWDKRLEREMPLILSEIKKTNGKRILDIGGGIGMHSLFLQEKGYDVLLADPDVKSLEIAKSNGVKNTVEATFNNFVKKEPGNFDFILSLGNALTAVNQEDFKQFAVNSYKVLNKNGRIFAQILNYDAILKNEYFVISSKINNNTHNLRFIEPFNEHKAEFHLISTDLEKESSVISKRYFYTHFVDTIKKNFQNAGYKEILFYADYQKTKHSKETGKDTIFIAVK